MKRKKTTKKTDRAFPEEVYENIDLDSLVTYAVWSIQQNGEACTFERLVEECFRLFPNKFSMFGYPQWPDAARINKSWLRCRTDKGLISGKTKTGFTLTPKGREHVRRLLDDEQSFTRSKRQVAISKRRADMATGTLDAVIRWIESSPYYARFRERTDGFALTEEEVRDFLQCVRETPRRVLRERLSLYKSAVDSHSRNDLMEIVLYCEKSFPYLFRAKGG